MQCMYGTHLPYHCRPCVDKPLVFLVFGHISPSEQKFSLTSSFHDGVLTHNLFLRRELVISRVLTLR